MNIIKKTINYFSKFEIFLLLTSLTLITVFFCLFDKKNFLVLLASLIGATSLIFCAKGNPFGQGLIIIFSIIYGVISYQCKYYGEMITYLGMTMPMAIIALVTWLKNPYNGNKSTVKIQTISIKEFAISLILTAIITTTFYFVLKHFNTANLIISTISVATSFLAVYLTFRRSPFYAIAYALNDVVLIILWSLELKSNISAISVVVCFATFLVNDIYAYINWKKILKKQTKKN